MSDNEKKLYQAIMQDREAVREVIQAGTRDEQVAIVVRMSKAKRLPVSAQAVMDFFRHQDQEMSDGELETVVGGKGSPHENIKGDKWAWIGFRNDNLSGGDGNDTIDGYTGDDTLDGGSGNDYMWGGMDEDSMTGGSGNDVMDGGDHDDYMDGGSGNDQMVGGANNDTMHGGSGNDTMSGDGGQDVMTGGAGNDYLSGGLGNDNLSGGEGNDTLDGGLGDDVLKGGAGNDVLDGGLGRDVFVFGDNDGTDRIEDFNWREDTLQLTGASRGDITVSGDDDGNTVVTYGDTTIILEGVELSESQVWSRVRT